MTKLYSAALLKRFDRLTMKLSSHNQLDRINARLELPKFEAEYGKEVCQAMFEELKRRDARKAGRGGD